MWDLDWHLVLLYWVLLLKSCFLFLSPHFTDSTNESSSSSTALRSIFKLSLQILVLCWNFIFRHYRFQTPSLLVLAPCWKLIFKLCRFQPLSLLALCRNLIFKLSLHIQAVSLPGLVYTYLHNHGKIVRTFSEMEHICISLNNERRIPELRLEPHSKKWEASGSENTAGEITLV